MYNLRHVEMSFNLLFLKKKIIVIDNVSYFTSLKF